LLKTLTTLDIATRAKNIFLSKTGLYSLYFNRNDANHFLDRNVPDPSKIYRFGQPEVNYSYYELTIENKYKVFNRIIALDDIQKFAQTEKPFWKTSWKDYDPKDFWEVARGWQWLPAIIKAKEINDIENIIKKIIFWLEKNPYPYGLSWASGLEVAIRAVNLFIIYQITRENVLLRYIYEHFLYLKKMIYYSRGTIKNNHYLGELTALTILSKIFEPRNIKKLRTLLEIEITNQFYSDGVNFEQSIRYHKFALEFVLLAILFLNIDARDIEKSANFLLAIKKPNNEWPSLGDDDLGCVIRLNDNPLSDDYNDIIDLSGLLFKDTNSSVVQNIKSPLAEFFLPEFKKKDKASVFETTTKKTFLFPKGGYLIHRTGWNKDSDYFLLKFGPHRWHAHADLFHIELSISGIPVLIDSGTFRYNNAEKFRKYFRSTSAHNTLEFNATDQTKQFTNFRWFSPARVLNWDFNEKYGELYFKAIHDGYYKTFRIFHERNVSIDKKMGWIEVKDIVKGKGKGFFKIFWHFAPGLKLKKVNKNLVIVVKKNDENYEIVKLYISAEGKYNIIIKETLYSPMYTVLEKQPTLIIESEKNSSITWLVTRFEKI
jgi:hypothetical protein